MALDLPLMVWIALLGNVLWVAVYAVLFRVIDFESDYMMSADGIEGDVDA